VATQQVQETTKIHKVKQTLVITQLLKAVVAAVVAEAAVETAPTKV
jgi:hypothetical protein